ncbi:IclR family transcriptional regulator [Halopenitus persicus]|uniref:Transcriptional regulator, IclR family n=1 Tax=Halopenitus persicus TaxID=1048396 RepID=A0A1H3P0C2_9EURY|nr:IclR family transcriptional regulator [Halopenitus persicus]SDY94594.1 transcriptional regulator, IclR family [Halopenitus persicus]
MGKTNKENVHSTTEQAIRLLDAIRRANGATISDLLTEFDTSRSVLYTHLNTLTNSGLVIRENGRYWMGIRSKEFSVAAETRKPSYQLVKNEIQYLEDEFEAETEFLVEEAGRINILYHSENIDHNRVRLYAHNTAAGKAILADLPDQRVHEILNQHGLPQQTENTITDRDELFNELEVISERGYAYNNNECFDGYHGIGATVDGIDGSVLGAVTLGGPIYRIPENRLKNELVDALQNTINEIEKSIEANRSNISSELASED